MFNVLEVMDNAGKKFLSCHDSKVEAVVEVTRLCNARGHTIHSFMEDDCYPGCYDIAAGNGMAFSLIVIEPVGFKL